MSKKTRLDINKMTQKGHILPRGIRFMDEPRYASAPYMVTYFVNGEKRRKFESSILAATTFQRGIRKRKKRNGDVSFDYDFQAHADNELARDILGEEISKAELARFYLRNKSKAEIPTVEQAAKMFMDLKRDRSECHQRSLKVLLGKFMAEFGTRQIDDVSGNEVLQMVARLRGAPRSKKNLINTISSMMNYFVRRGVLAKNPCSMITKHDLPIIRKGRVGIMTPEHGHAIMRFIEKEYPQMALWAALKFFAGVRWGEARRFQPEWIDRKLKRIVIPGWFYDSGEIIPGAKTRDDWAIDNIHENFWLWAERYQEIKSPCNKSWAIIKRAVGTPWPVNGWRHSFATYDLSLHRDQSRTSLMLRHQNTKRLWSNYLAFLVPKEVAEYYFSIKPNA